MEWNGMEGSEARFHDDDEEEDEEDEEDEGISKQSQHQVRSPPPVALSVLTCVLLSPLLSCPVLCVRQSLMPLIRAVTNNILCCTSASKREATLALALGIYEYPLYCSKRLCSKSK